MKIVSIPKVTPKKKRKRTSTGVAVMIQMGTNCLAMIYRDTQCFLIGSPVPSTWHGEKPE